MKLTELYQQLFYSQLEIDHVIHQPTAKNLKKWSEPGTVMGILAAGKEKNQSLLVVCQLGSVGLWSFQLGVQN